MDGRGKVPNVGQYTPKFELVSEKPVEYTIRDRPTDKSDRPAEQADGLICNRALHCLNKQVKAEHLINQRFSRSFSKSPKRLERDNEPLSSTKSFAEKTRPKSRIRTPHKKRAKSVGKS